MGSNPTIAYIILMPLNPTKLQNTSLQCESHDGLVAKHTFSVNTAVIEAWVQIPLLLTLYWCHCIQQSSTNTSLQRESHDGLVAKHTFSVNSCDRGMGSNPTIAYIILMPLNPTKLHKHKPSMWKPWWVSG